MEHKRPRYPFIPHMWEKVIGVRWDQMSDEQRIEYCKIQFMLAVQDLEQPKTDVAKRLEQLGKYIRKPIYASESFTDAEKGKYHAMSLTWATKKVPQTRWMAIRVLDKRYWACERMLQKKYIARKNEFLRTMGIRPVDRELSAEELFHQIFDDPENKN